MAHILVVSGHPDLNHSIANATILDELATALPDAEIRRLDWLYPDGKFNIAAEQESLLQADVIVWPRVPGQAFFAERFCRHPGRRS